MLVYRDQKQTIAVRQTLASLRRLADSSAFDHDHAVELLVEFGQLEAGIADTLYAERDAPDPILDPFRRTSLLLGHVLYHSWRGTGETEKYLRKAQRALASLDGLPSAEVIQTGVPEGYGYYGLYPEMNLESASRFCREQHPHRVVVIGLRNIGTSLSAVVGATLEELGCEVHSYTVRPRGHPFDRYLGLAWSLEEEWRAISDAYFLVVDEGPGLSGSSLACVAQKLSALGIPDERIVFFPSWEPDGTQFVSESARVRWRKHIKYTTSFEQLWIESGRLAQVFQSGELIDISGGKWRALLYSDEAEYPAVQPQHERRKYLCTPTLTLPRNAGEGTYLLKFAGLGRYGRERLARAELLADAGFAPRPIGLASGFIAMEFVPGQPLSPRDVNQDLLDSMARYLAFVDRTFPATLSVSFDLLMEMIRTNVAEGLGDEWRGDTERVGRFRQMVSDARAVAIDGRMLPHEWLKVGDGYLKTDGLDHHDDHFFPGTQNSGWDIAGTCIEFELDGAQREYLIERYAALSNDRALAALLPFYSIAYLAFRLGYARMAVQLLHGSSDGERFERQADKYANLLRREIGETLRVF